MEIWEILVMGLALAWAGWVLYRSLFRRGSCPGCPGSCPQDPGGPCGQAGECDQSQDCDCAGECGEIHRK
ncbi:MAG: hypothetical protein ABIJ95_10430 [Pseudomonadota bacterium]